MPYDMKNSAPRQKIQTNGYVGELHGCFPSHALHFFQMIVCLGKGE